MLGRDGMAFTTGVWYFEVLGVVSSLVAQTLLVGNTEVFLTLAKNLTHKYDVIPFPKLCA
jgi:hypothetical protein